VFQIKAKKNIAIPNEKNQYINGNRELKKLPVVLAVARIKADVVASILPFK